MKYIVIEKFIQFIIIGTIQLIEKSSSNFNCRYLYHYQYLFKNNPEFLPPYSIVPIPTYNIM